MKLNLLLFNVHSLNDKAVVDALKLYVQDFRPAIDILFFQEHKLCGLALPQLGTTLWKPAQLWGLEASSGYINLLDDDGIRCDGVATFLALQWACMVTCICNILDNRVLWFLLEGLLGGTVEIANIHAPNESPIQSALWTAMVYKLSQHA